MSWQIEFRNGVWLPQIGWWLDAHFPVARSFVSHAHFDHVAEHREIIASAGTARLMRARLPAKRTEHVLPFGQTESLTATCAITLHPAGHIYGSAQALLTHEHHGSLLYTGDFKLRPGLSAEPCATPHADTLIMETTFGRPQYVFPPTVDVLRAISHFCEETLSNGETPVLFGYSLGKSQELLSGLSEARLPVMLHPQTCKLTRIYEEMGLTFPPYREFDAEELAGHVVICPPQARDSSFIRKIPQRRTAMITGWAMDPGAIYRYQCDAAFPLSDHADYADLLRFVERVAPQRVLTLHGFSREFAQTLRDRGIEAWAINQDNQLEFGLARTSVAASAPVVEESADSPEASPAPIATEAFARFVEVADAVKATAAKLEKIALLQAYLRALHTDDAAIAAVFLTGRPFPQSDPRTLTLGWSIVKRAVLELAPGSESAYREAYNRFADAGDATGAVLVGKTSPRPCPLGELATFFDQVAAARGPAAKLELLRERFRTLSTGEIRYLVKIITGDLRIGLKMGLLEEAIAVASGRTLDEVREANMLCGDIAAVVRAARAGELHTIQLRVFNPLQFMLASPEPTADAIVARFSELAAGRSASSGAPLEPSTTPVSIWLEEKYDGIRCQLHKAGTRVELYSRDLNRITETFPELAAAARELPGDAIIDGELLAWRDGRALPFAELQKRLGRKGGDDFFLGSEIPVSLSCYDLLWRDGRTLLKTPLAERREELTALLSPLPTPLSARFPLAPVQHVWTAAEIDAAFLAARQRGNEGLMAKDPQSAYTPGRRGLAWLKLKKAYATLDVVVVGAEYGHGKRHAVLSDYTFAIRDEENGNRLLTVGKAYSGLTDAEIIHLTQHFLDHTLEVHGRFRRVVPDTVLEIAFDSIQPSDRHESGFALRFPRIARIRADKTPAEIDTLETCRRLAAPPAFAARR